MSLAEAEGILAAPQFLSSLQEVERFNPVRMPVKRASGEIVLLPEGYDAQSLTFTAKSDVGIPDVPIEQARESIEKVLSEFGFADEGRSKAVAVSAMLTVFGVGLLPPLALPPAFIFLANREGAGNGATVSSDMRRRSLFVELFLDVERAEGRVFKTRLEAALVLKYRARILAALWSLIRSWEQAGRPKPSQINSGFPEWSEVFGGIVQHAGFGCALETPEIEGAGDTDATDMRSLVGLLAQDQAFQTATFADLVNAAQGAGPFSRLIPEEGEPDRSGRSAFSKILGRYDGCIVGQHRFALEGKGHSRRFLLQRIAATTAGAVDTVSTVVSVPASLF